MTNDMVKLLLRSFNNECDYCVGSVKFNNFHANLKRIEKSYYAITKLGETTSVRIAPDYFSSKLRELELAFEY